MNRYNETESKLVFRTGDDIEKYGKEQEEKFETFLKRLPTIFEKVDNSLLDVPQPSCKKVLFIKATEEQDENEQWDFAFYVPRTNKWTKVDFTVGGHDYRMEKKKIKERERGIKILHIPSHVIDNASRGAEIDIKNVLQVMEAVLID